MGVGGIPHLVCAGLCVDGEVAEGGHMVPSETTAG